MISRLNWIPTIGILATCVGCTNSWQALRDQIPHDRGNSKSFAGGNDAVISAARSAVEGIPLVLVWDAPIEGQGGHMIIGEKGVSLFGWGGWARLIIKPTGDDGTSEVWVATDRRNVMDMAGPFDYSPQIFAAMEAELSVVR